ncbi:GNAT family N-acetyltransferase [Jiangella asiatica]|uniref:GNAT family N-acetyltransferase n=1 Tax=Jiangella asiatica TaxID=2530372 RepID=A0A4R5CNE8_9ACTN|nr:GNAT family N-acetyltransferase [Jiangella asiatica]TDE00251.1 GNAT family N-acetyltransferase [Jiangella asiatica]
MTFTYEPARDDEAAAIAALHARSWRVAYRGHVPDAFLDGDLDGERLAEWTERFADRAGTLTVVARDAGGELAGFAHTMLDHHPEWGAFLDNLHVRPELRRHGIGRRLLTETATRLRAADPDARLYLRVLEANEPARRFYRALGANETGGEVSHLGGGELPVLRCTWERVDTLAAAGMTEDRTS